MIRKLIIEEMSSQVCNCFSGSRAPKFSQVVKGVTSMVFTAECALTRKMSGKKIPDCNGEDQYISDYKFPMVINNMANLTQVYLTPSIGNSGIAKPLWDVCTSPTVEELKQSYLVEFGTGDKAHKFTDDDGKEAIFDGEWCYIMTPEEIDEIAFRWNSYIRNGSLNLGQMNKVKNDIFSVGMFLGADRKMHYLQVTADRDTAATLQLLNATCDCLYRYTDPGELMNDSAIRRFVRKLAVLEKGTGEGK